MSKTSMNNPVAKLQEFYQQRKNTVLFIVFLILVILLPLIIMQVKNQQEIRQRASGNDITFSFSALPAASVGQTVTTNLLINSHGQVVTGMDISLSYDATAVEIVSIENPTTASFDTPLIADINTTTGTLRAAAVQHGNTVLTPNDSAVAVITLRAKRQGPTNVSLSQATVTGAGSNLPNHGSLTVAGVGGAIGNPTFTFGPASESSTPIAWWKMNDASWSGQNLVIDSSSPQHTYNGIPKNGAAVVRSILGNTSTLVGSFNGQNTYIQAPNLEYRGGKMTLVAWVNPDSDANTGQILSQYFNPNGYNYQFLVNQNGTIALALAGTTEWSLTSSRSIQKGQWNFIAATLDQTDVVKLYINGTIASCINSDASCSLNSVADWTPQGGDQNLPLTIGTLFSNGTPQTFKGKMANVRIYNTTLSDSDVATLYFNDLNITPTITSGANVKLSFNLTLPYAQTQTKTAFVKMYDCNNTEIPASGQITKDATGSYTGLIDMGNLPVCVIQNCNANCTSDAYTIKIKMNHYLQKLIGKDTNSIAQHITLGQTYTVPQVALIPGDINNDNRIFTDDYNILLSCFGPLANAATCGGHKTDADLNDDGNVDAQDQQIYLIGSRSSQQGD